MQFHFIQVGTIKLEECSRTNNTNNSTKWQPRWLGTTSTCYVQKTVTFHLHFGSEILDLARYEQLTLYSLANLRLADKILGRIKGGKGRMLPIR